MVMTDRLRTGKSPCFKGKSTISMVIFNSYDGEIHEISTGSFSIAMFNRQRDRVHDTSVYPLVLSNRAVEISPFFVVNS